MYKINFKEPIHIHFIGIGGISMSGLAEILCKEHFTVSGSDARESGLTRHPKGPALRSPAVRPQTTSQKALISSSTPQPSARITQNLPGQRSLAFP